MRYYLHAWFNHHINNKLRLLVIFGALILSAILPSMASQRVIILISLLLLGGSTVVIFMHWAPLGLLSLIIATLLVPFAIGTGTQTSINVTVLLLTLLMGLWLFDMIVQKRQLKLTPSKTNLPLVAFIIVSVFSFISGQLPWFIFAQSAPLLSQVGGLAVFFLSAGAFLLVANQIKEIVWLERLTWLFLILGGSYIAGQLLPMLGQVTNRLFQNGSTGSLFWVWLVALAFSQSLFNQGLSLHWRLALGALVLSTFYVNIVQGQTWTSGWLPPLVSVVVINWAFTSRFGFLVTTAAAAVATVNLQRISSFVMVGGNAYSLMTRLEAWRILGEIVKVNPILGLGPANYYWYTPLFPILGYSVVFNSHNNYVDIIAQTGLLGLGCFLWFVWEVGRLGWQLRSRVPEGFARAYVIGALGGLAGTLAAGMLGDWFLPFVYNIGLNGFRASVLGWLFLGGLVVLEKTTNNSSKNTTDPI